MIFISFKRKISACLAIIKAPVMMVTNHSKGGIHTIEVIIRKVEDSNERKKL